ncbi:MAG: cobyrinate a,c-diamide synthase [Deltaproteobacteria bacterium]|nr:cobyrinate a,c-diamide synthase [Deltaproteobacteria bacterium]
MSKPCPRLLLAALRGGAGKTTLTLGLLAAWRDQGRRLVPFKKGPDYIDPAWHALAAGCPSHNLDPFLMEGDQILAMVARQASLADALVIEGNRGLYDGLDAQGTYSTGELAKFLATPVVLVVDCTMRTRTTAAMVLGCQHFDPEVPIRGVVLNQIARPRHEDIIRNAIERYCGIPVLGAIPRLKCEVFPERHMGLVPPQEHATAIRAINTARDLAQKYLDLDGLWQVACQAPPLPAAPIAVQPVAAGAAQVTIGVIRDSAFQFYYPENLEALEAQGARLVEVSALDDAMLPPDLDALYIGGGFPETHAQALADNLSFRQSVKAAAESGLPIYAECGGLMFLGETIQIREDKFPMAGVFPYDFVMGKKPQGHGYTVLEVVQENPFFPIGARLMGHEFHYSQIVPDPAADAPMAFRVSRGTGMGGRREGLVFNNVLATYTHLHAMGAALWAPALVQRALEHHRDNLGLEEPLDESAIACREGRLPGSH